MNRAQAKEALLLYRPGSADAQDPEVATALELTKTDEELRRWFEQQQAVQAALRRKFREIPVPEFLKDAILAERKLLRPSFWARPPAWLAAAAAIVLLLGIAALLLQGPRPPDRFADFRSRMVRTVLREYRMDIVTNDMTQVRRFMAARGAPADYVVTKGLAALPLTGGGLLRWRDNPVSMVCFDRGGGNMLYLFVIKRGVLKGAPPDLPQTAKVNKLATVSWSQGDETYVLAGEEDPQSLQRRL